MKIFLKFNLFLGLLFSVQAFSQEMSADVQSVKTFLVDKNATDTTAIMFYNMKKSAATGIMLGQQDAFTNRFGTDNNPDMTDMKLTTGKHPLVIGLDFMFITDVQNTPGSWFEGQEKIIIAQAKKNYKKGLISTFTWHFRNPYTYDWFSIDTQNPDQVTIAKKSLPSILKGGEKHVYYKSVLKKIASVFAELKDENGNLIPVFFRPFHEFDGSWFWWGKPYCTPQQFKDNWKFTVQYLRDSLAVHNVLYAFSPDNGFSSQAQYLERYPGDDYVDLLGMDNYSDFESNNIAAAGSKLKIISDYAKAHNKLAALTEAGYRNSPVPTDLFTKRYLAVLTVNPIELSYMMFWSNSSTAYFVPTPNQSSTADFLTFANNPITLLDGDTPPVYSFADVTSTNAAYTIPGLKITCHSDSSHPTECFIELDNRADMSIEVYNLNGTVVHNQKATLKKGSNKVILDLRQQGGFVARFILTDPKSHASIFRTIKIVR